MHLKYLEWGRGRGKHTNDSSIGSIVKITHNDITTISHFVRKETSNLVEGCLFNSIYIVSDQSMGKICATQKAG